VASNLLVLLAMAGTARATEVGSTRTVGLGVAIGEPTGLVGKLFLSPENAVDAGISFVSAFSRCRSMGEYRFCSGDTTIALHGDYLWQFNLVDETVKLDWHFGAGGRVWLFAANDDANDFMLAARMPFGLNLTFDEPEFLEVFLELSPALLLIPAIGFDVQPCLGVRFYF
jgi:hypothetical protein